MRPLAESPGADWRGALIAVPRQMSKQRQRKHAIGLITPLHLARYSQPDSSSHISNRDTNTYYRQATAIAGSMLLWSRPLRDPQMISSPAISTVRCNEEQYHHGPVSINQ